jgi:selenocysteine lyase/cysteine desulfurase
MREFLDDWRDHGERWEAWLQDVVEARNLFAKLIHAQRDEVACIPNVSSGLGGIASSLQFGKRSNVVVSELNFPTNIYLWHTLKARGFVDEVRVLKAQDGQIPLTAYEKAIDGKTAAVSIDYVSWINGCRERIAEITKLAHTHEAFMLVDVFHAAGVLPIDVDRLEVDALLCGTYKWLMGPHGTAFLYINPAALAEFKPSIVGWHGIKDSVIARVQSNEDPFGRPFDLTQAEPAENATRFEWGTWAVVAVEGAKAALEFTLKYPPEERWPLIQRLNERVVDGVRRKGLHVTSPAGRERSSGIVTFEIPEAGKVAKRLMEDHVVVAPRVNTLRVSPHFYNTETEIDQFLKKI